MRPVRALTGLQQGLGALLAALIVLTLSAPLARAQSAPDFPPLTGRVVDQANLLSPETEQALTQKLAALEASSTDQLVVVTLNSLQDREIEDYGYQLGRAWGIGQKEGDNGALLIVAPNERKVRIEVGYGLEPILTDAFSSLVIQNDILPSFRDGDFEAGIVKGVDALVAQLELDPAEAQARAEAARVEQEKPDVPIGAVIVICVVGLLFFAMMIGAIGAAGRGRRHGGGDGVTPILIWAAAEALKNSGRGGGWGGGGFGGGGFGGGGGSFGGGGASGGW